ncbi:MAG: apolipoprotein N-acyltransferase [Alphaproteobacteria bacterium]|nr:apolipoprotein N-acyltransferase [Alphaproteobacteria bacterium]
MKGRGLSGASAWLGGLSPWRACAAAFVAGVGACLALAPLHWAPVLLFSFTTLIWLMDGVSTVTGWRGARAAAARGWWFGFGFFLPGLYWTGFALTVDPESFGVFIPVAVLALPAGLALLYALALALARPSWRAASAARIPLLAVCWSIGEWLRGHLFTGFPWNLIGYVWSADAAPLMNVLQSASFLGIYGLGLITLLIAGLPAVLANGGVGQPRVALPLLGGVILLAGLSVYGASRLAQPAPADVDGVRLRIVQPSIAQAAKWLPEQRAAIFRTLMDLSSTPSALPPTHIIWPEAATPFFLQQSEAALAQMARLVPASGAVITGAPRLGDGNAGASPVYNSVLAVDGDGGVAAIYDKAHLVPFGEYLPFPAIFSAIGLKKLTADLGSFSAGPGPQTLHAPGIPDFSPLICYEIIFPEQIIAQGVRPAWILNVTNDAWFGDTSGPQQHLVQARMRAVEQGLPLIRAANNGISGVFDAYGRNRGQLVLNQRGIIDTALPGALHATLYALYGNYVFYFLILLFVAVITTINRLSSTHTPELLNK